MNSFMSQIDDKLIFSCTLNLPPGIYQYKFLCDPDWFLDNSKNFVLDKQGNKNHLIVLESFDNIYRIKPINYKTLREGYWECITVKELMNIYGHSVN